MKDSGMEEKERTIKKLYETNKGLREDIRRESERYYLLENKYKDLLVKHNLLAKENAKNAEMLFSMNTGGNINNYGSFLEHGDDKPSVKGTSTSKKFREGSLDRNFEDVF